MRRFDVSAALVYLSMVYLAMYILYHDYLVAVLPPPLLRALLFVASLFVVTGHYYVAEFFVRVGVVLLAPMEAIYRIYRYLFG